jgi:predicted Rossmann fold flavoprotein
MLVAECEAAKVKMSIDTEVTAITPRDDGTFFVQSEGKQLHSRKVVIACGGLSIPKIASDLAFRTANALNIKVVPPRAALVPFTWNSRDKNKYADLSGISIDATLTCGGVSFRENILFTHRGLSGPGVLQISSFWREGASVLINLLPDDNAATWLIRQREKNPQQRLVTLLKTRFPNRLVEQIAGDWFDDIKLGSYSPKQLEQVGRRFNHWEFRPGGTEGYRTAEVTLGGIDTDELSSKTFELKKVVGLYAIGEAVDVTGWLGGYNFQWAWASAYSCAQFL